MTATVFNQDDLEPCYQPTTDEWFSTIDQRLTHIENQLTEMYSIFCQLYKAYESMSKSPMLAGLIGRVGG